MMLGKAAILTGALVAVVAVGCGSGGTTLPPPSGGSPLILTAGLQTVDPVDATEAQLRDPVLQRYGADRADAVYELTTPAGEAFRFQLSLRGSADGPVQLSLAHGRNGGITTGSPAQSMGDAGLVPFGNGAAVDGDWIEFEGEGLARCTVQGEIEQDQELVVKTVLEGRAGFALVHVRLGARSRINVDDLSGSGLPLYEGIERDRTLHSSDSWRYGFPAAAQSGDLTTVIVYEGGEPRPWDADPWEKRAMIARLHEVRLQYDREADETTMADPVEVGAGNGWFRDHEIAAHDEVLAVARATPFGVSVDLSFDRGATFTQSEGFGGSSATYAFPIVQVDLAPGGELALVFWRQEGGPIYGIDDEGGFAADRNEPPTFDFTTELMLVRGHPSATDDDGVPTAYTFDDPVVIRSVEGDVQPTIMGVKGNEEGDWVIGYGYTDFDFDFAEGTLITTTDYRCAVLLSDGTERDTEVDVVELAALDPSVAILGSGGDLHILYAYESEAGIRLRSSDDAGETFGAADEVEALGSYMAQVFARSDGDALRVDLLYLRPSDAGLELALRHWDDFESGEPVDARLTTASVEEIDGPSSNSMFGNLRITQVGEHGYDAAQAGDGLIVVVHEYVLDLGRWFDDLPPLPPEGGPGGPPPDGGPGTPGGPSIPDERGMPTTPGPEGENVQGPKAHLTGLTDPAPTPDPEEVNQLRLLILP